MTDLEMGIVCFINEMHRKVIYKYENYQMLHNVKYKKQMDAKYVDAIREKYKGNCFEIAYELKTYYMENDILSNTIVLKMRPELPEIQDFRMIKVYSEIDDEIYEYTHHAIEIFKEHGRYKVFDVLHTDKVVWLEDYLDGICRANDCPREQLRYDGGYLTPCHILAGNMQELADLMRYLDRKYCMGNPRINLLNVPNSEGEALILSDDIAMDFDAFAKVFQIGFVDIEQEWGRVYSMLMEIRYNLLNLLCLGHIMRDSLVRIAMAEALFDDAKICQMMDEYMRR